MNKEVAMPEHPEPSQSSIDRLVTWMAVAAIAVTVGSILFPTFPASLSIAVDTGLIVLIGAVANEHGRGSVTATEAAGHQGWVEEPSGERLPIEGGADVSADLHFASRGATIAYGRASSSDG